MFPVILEHLIPLQQSEFVNFMATTTKLIESVGDIFRSLLVSSLGPFARSSLNMFVQVSCLRKDSLSAQASAMSRYAIILSPVLRFLDNFLRHTIVISGT